MFKIGDLVRVKDTEKARKYADGVGMNDQMEKETGRIGSVIGIVEKWENTLYRISIDAETLTDDYECWYWAEEWLELLQEAPSKIQEKSILNESYSRQYRLKTIEELESTNISKYNISELNNATYFFLNGFISEEIYNKLVNKNTIILRGRLLYNNNYFRVKSGKDYYTIPESFLIKKEEKEKKEKEKMSIENQDIINEMISKVDVKRFKKTLASAFQIPATKLLGVDIMLKNWAMSKMELYKLLDNNLSITQDIEYQADIQEWKTKIIDLSRKFPGIGYMLRNIPPRLFVANEYEPFDNAICELYGRKSGMKLTTFLSEIFNNKEFDTELSKVIEQTKVKGKIVISIDPNDFLTMSFNQSGWCSCHTISHSGNSRDFGEFVGGIFSYIEDKNTVISYRHNGHKIDFPIGKAKIQDYSKNWRELFYIDTKRNAFVASRQYPSYNEEISKSVRELLEAQISKVRGIQNSWKKIESESESFYSEFMTDVDNPLHYNDMLHGYRGKLLINKELNNKDDISMEIGSEPICPICGIRIIENSNMPVCDECWNNYEFEN